jgi:P27 family predicted phage terminase small subunit
MILKLNEPTPKPPKHLSRDSKAWWTEVITGWKLEQHHRKILTAACEALDRATEARKAVARDGAYVKNRFGEVVKHPAIGVERDALITFARMLRELDLDNEPPKHMQRLPALRSNRV